MLLQKCSTIHFLVGIDNCESNENCKFYTNVMLQVVWVCSRSIPSYVINEHLKHVSIFKKKENIKFDLSLRVSTL